jgi:hypothetical protein
MAQLVTTDLKQLANAVSNAQPAMALGVVAVKGQKATDEIYLIGGPPNSSPLSGTSTDAAPALTAINVYLQEMLYLAWKVAGKQTVEVRQYLLAEDGEPVGNQSWVSLPTTGGRPSNPNVTTDAAPAIAVGANNQLYMVWKTPGADAGMEWSLYDGTGWSAPAPVPSAKTSTAPALAGFNSSGPGNVWPLCLAYKGATGDGVFWAMFTPGSTTLTQNTVPGATTDTAVAVTLGPSASGAAGPAFVLLWKPQGQTSYSFVTVQGTTAGQVYTLPQTNSNLGPAAVDSWNSTSGFGASVFDNLTVTYVDSNTGDLWQGVWEVILNPAPFPGGTLEGSVNYVFYRNTSCALLDEIVVTINIAEDLTTTDSYSFQLNANTPTNAKNYLNCNWQQCGFQVDTLGNLSSWVNNWTLNNGYASSTPSASPNPWDLHKWPNPTMPAGTQLTIALQYNGDTVTAATFTYSEPGNKTQSITIPPGETPSNFIAPICVLQLVIVGLENYEHVIYTKGAGTVTYSCANPLIAGDSRPTCSGTWGTGELSNLLYGVLPASPATSLTQTFCASSSSTFQAIRDQAISKIPRIGRNS